MRVLIVDDEAPARARLARLLSQVTEVIVAGEAGDGVEALAQVAALAPDAVFLDVQMPEVDGFDVAASLPEDGPAVVFVTAHDRYALQAFDAGAADYLLKPVEPARLLRSVERLRRVVRARHSPRPPRRLLVPDRGRTHVVPCDEIEWLEAADNYVALHLPGRQVLIRRTLSGLLADLGETFVRTHRGAAVALRHVVAVEANAKGDADVRLASGAVAPCSRLFRDALVRRLG